MRVAIIPARGGSKRIPRKNVKPFAGKPMIAYAIEAALGSGLFDETIVSTDDDEIAEVARRYGAALPFRRPPELADDHTPTVPVIQHAIQTRASQGAPVTYACCIYPGVPFIRASDLAAARALLDERGGRGYTFPVTSFPSPIQRALRRSAEGSVEPFDARYVGTRTQDLETAFFDAGQFYWGRAETWLAGLTIHDNGGAILLPEWRVVDIDTVADWERAEVLYSAFSRMSEQ